MYNYGTVGILIGSDFYYKLKNMPCQDLPSGFTLLDSLLGKIIVSIDYAKLDSIKTFTSHVNLSSAVCVNSLNKQVFQFFFFDSIDIVEEPPETLSLEEYQESIKFNRVR